MGMGMGVSFHYPMGMGMGIDVIFENRYECGYSSTRPEPIPLPFLAMLPTSFLHLEDTNFSPFF